MKIFLVLFNLFSLNAFSNDLSEATYRCRYSNSYGHPVDVSKIEIFKTHLSDYTLCISFYEYKGGVKSIIGKSCGLYNRNYGQRKDSDGTLSSRYAGFEDFVDQSHVSIPPAKKRVGVLKTYENNAIIFLIMGDRRIAPDIEYSCTLF